MRGGEDPSDRRKEIRFRVREGAFVAPKADERKLWQILDISRGGMAFRYVGNEASIDWADELDIVTADTVFSLEDISYKSISDFEIIDKTASSYQVRRHSLQFRNLNRSQTTMLEYFIQNHTIGDA